MIRPRIIPVLLLQGDRLIKTKSFSNPRYIGDPINTIKLFNDLMVDELIIIDIEKRSLNQVPDYRLLSEIAQNAFMPICYGGGITSVDQAKKIISCGLEKVCLNYSVNKFSQLFNDIASKLGEASVVACIDIKRNFWGRVNEYNYQTKKFGESLDQLIQHVNQLGVGELLLHDVDREGLRMGYDLRMLETVQASCSKPFIMLGGAGTREHLVEALKTGAPALGAASLFIYMGSRDGVLINYPSQEELHEICGE